MKERHPIPEDLRPLFVCPACHGVLDWSADDRVACTACGRVYPSRGGIPDFVVEDEPDPPRP